jgi:hypothetical protein
MRAAWGQRAVLLLGCACIAAAFPAPFTESTYYSAGKVFEVQARDLALEGALEATIAKRSFKGELVIFSFTASGYWIDWAVNMARQLESVGYAHYIALSFPSDCKAFTERMPHAACAWFTLPGPHWAQNSYSIDYLWTMRYHVSTLLAQYNVNVLVLDMDCIIRRDVYVDLKLPPLQDVQLIHLEEGWANGGLFYLQNASARGPAVWTHAEVFRRADAVLRVKQRDGVDLGTVMDQAMLNDAINAAASLHGSAYNWPSTYVTGDKNHNHTFWLEHDRGKHSSRAKGQAWYDSAWSYSETRYAAPIRFSNMKPEAPWNAFRSAKLENVQLKYMPIRVPFDVLTEHENTTEVFAAAPQWTFGSAENERYNWPVVAVTHLVAASADWGDDRQWTHSGRRALMAAAGAWEGAQTYQGVLRKVVTLSSAVVEAELSKDNSKQGVTELVQRFFAAAAALGRLPGLFAIPCNLPWLERHEMARVVSDTRVVVHGSKCYPATGGELCWHEFLIYAFEVKSHELAVRTRDSFEDAKAASDADHVRLRHLPLNVSEGIYTVQHAQLKQKCFKFFVT